MRGQITNQIVASSIRLSRMISNGYDGAFVMINDPPKQPHWATNPRAHSELIPMMNAISISDSTMAVTRVPIPSNSSTAIAISRIGSTTPTTAATSLGSSW